MPFRELRIYSFYKIWVRLSVSLFQFTVAGVAGLLRRMSSQTQDRNPGLKSSVRYQFSYQRSSFFFPFFGEEQKWKKDCLIAG